MVSINNKFICVVCSCLTVLVLLFLFARIYNPITLLMCRQTHAEQVNRTTIADHTIKCLKSLQDAGHFNGTNCHVSTSKTTTKKFAYLTQTEGCLNDYLKSTEVWGDPSSCQCDVLVLSYKQKCTDKSKPHIQYIFNSSTTWTTGRNLLYETIISRERDYLYYTFLDDDIVLRFRDANRHHVKENPWREYERSLLKVKPLIGVSWGGKTEEIFYRYYRGCCVYPQDTKFLPFVWFDAMFNSFHRKVICHLLPYNDKYDKIDWWNSQVYLLFKTAVMFPGQGQLHLDVFAGNPAHRPYPRNEHAEDPYKLMAEDIRKETPKKYHALLEPKIQDWVANHQYIQNHFPNFCPNPVAPLPSDLIFPYSHLKCPHEVVHISPK